MLFRSGNPSCNLRNPTTNKIQLNENKDTATNWSFDVVPGKARGNADAIRKKGAHAVVYSILGPKGSSLCLIQPMLTSDANASSQLSPGFSSPTRCSGVDSLAGYQRDCPLNHSESPAPFTANGLGCSYLVRAV